MRHLLIIVVILFTSFPTALSLPSIMFPMNAFQRDSLTNAEKQTIVQSPDKRLSACITTVGGSDTTSPESRIKFITIKGKSVCSKSYISIDHCHGIEIQKGEWTPDSKYFIFNGTIACGHQPGHWPTYIYSRMDNKILSMDALVGIWVTSDFKLMPNDNISVMVRDKLPDGGFSDSLVKVFRLGDLLRKK